MLHRCSAVCGRCCSREHIPSPPHTPPHHHTYTHTPTHTTSLQTHRPAARAAQGDSTYQLEMLAHIKREHPGLDVICGNVVTSVQVRLCLAFLRG